MRQVRRASAAVPPRVHLCPRRRTHCTLDAVGLGGPVRCGAAASGGRLDARGAGPRSACMPTKPLSRCSSPVRARRIGPTSGPTPPGLSSRCALVVYDFVPAGAVCMRVSSRVSGKGNWSATTMRPTRDLFRNGVTEVGCLAHARRKFFELHEASKSTPGGHRARIHPEDLRGRAAGPGCQPAERLQARQQTSRPVSGRLA